LLDKELKYPGNVLVSLNNSKHYVELEKDSKYKFYAKVDTVLEGVGSAIDKYDGNVAIDALGYRLYGDTKAGYLRTDSMYLIQESLGNEKYSLYRPNAYLLQNTDEYLSTPLYHGRLRFITDSVPFLQVVLRGYIDYYSIYLNFSTNQSIDVLKCIEYGSNPAYLVSYEPSHLLSNTLSNYLYATHFESNKESIIDQTTMITEALSGVVGETITAREVLALGVVKVTYSNGTSIYVNYTNSIQKVDGIEILKQNYKVVA
jgi:DNA-binding beta-propeller fold protein YncE